MSSLAQDPGGPAALGLPIRIGIVFDLDGTLIDARRDIAEAADRALAAGGFAPLSVQEISSYVGDGARRLLAGAARLDLESAALDRILETFLAYYTAHPSDAVPRMSRYFWGTTLAHQPVIRGAQRCEVR